MDGGVADAVELCPADALCVFSVFTFLPLERSPAGVEMEAFASPSFVGRFSCPYLGTCVVFLFAVSHCV